jgi:predicted glycogen debranching enzyme
LRELEVARSREWLETNGLGGFASSTIIGLNTRRYHGLLTAALKPPGGRFLLLSKLEKTLYIAGQPFELSANQYPGAVYPQGSRFLKRFALDPFPIFTYEFEGVEIEKSVFMMHGENSVVIQYELRKNNHPETTADLRLEVRPLIAFRDYHSTAHENSVLNGNTEVSPGFATITPHAGLSPLHFGHNAVDVKKTAHWYRNFQYDVERERGLDFSEDLFNPFALRFDLKLREPASVIASTERRSAAQASEYRQSEIARRRKLGSSLRARDPFCKAAAAATDQFIVSRGAEHSVIAGYHWFGE